MKTIKAEATPSKTASTLEFSDELEGLSRAQRREVLDQIGELLVEQILDFVGGAKSPVSGNAFPKLSLEYAKRKREEAGNTLANLDVTGDMLEALDYRIQGDKIEIGVFGDQAPKADGHCNISGDSSLPRRRFIPTEGETFDRAIRDLVKQTVNTYRIDNLDLSKKDLEDVETKKDLYELLKERAGPLPKAKLRDLILVSDKANLLEDADLLDLL